MKWILSIHYVVWLIISTLFFGIGEFLSKKFVTNPTMLVFVFIIMTYLIGSVTWLPAIMQKNTLSIVGTIWSVLSFLMTLAIGLIIFGEKLTITGIVGIILAFISIILLSI